MGDRLEKLEIFNERGESIGEIKTRDEIHLDGDWHQSVHVWLINSHDQLLIQKRSPVVLSNPNKWDISAAGHVVSDHSPIETAIREFEEELGLRLQEKDFERLFTVKQKKVLNEGTYFNNEINPVYLVRKDLDLSKIKLQQEEVSEIKFIPWQELKQKIDAKDPSFVPHDEEYKKLFDKLRKPNQREI